MNYEVEFNGVHYLWLDCADGTGPLTDSHRFEENIVSYSHVYADGRIRRFGEVIGNRKDLTIIREVPDADLPQFTLGDAVERIFADLKPEPESEL